MFGKGFSFVFTQYSAQLVNGVHQRKDVRGGVGVSAVVPFAVVNHAPDAYLWAWIPRGGERLEAIESPYNS